MKIMRNVLLCGAAVPAMMSAALAADLPMAKAEAIEYVRACTEFGTGFVSIPGSDTCLLVGGYVRSDMIYRETHDRQTDAMLFQGRAQIKFDARTSTEYGLLRSLFAIDANFGDVDSSFAVHYAYLQFGGLTAGYVESAFNFYNKYYDTPIFATYAGEQGRRNILSYTAAFGGGLSATLSAEDGKEHSTSIVAPDPDGGYGGARMPDFVANLAYDGGKGGWGRAQLMGAVHQVRGRIDEYGTDYGCAVGAAVQVNLPFLAGGYAVVEGAYADGASDYTGGNKFKRAPDAFGGPGPDFAFDTAKSWSLVAETGIGITPNLTA
ncbi:MAG: porin, partial [Bradyrhizobium sp.]